MTEYFSWTDAICTWKKSGDPVRDLITDRNSIFVAAMDKIV